MQWDSREKVGILWLTWLSYATVKKKIKKITVYVQIQRNIRLGKFKSLLPENIEDKKGQRMVTKPAYIFIRQFLAYFVLNKIKYWILTLNKHEISQAMTNVEALSYDPITPIIILTIQIAQLKSGCKNTIFTSGDHKSSS